MHSASGTKRPGLSRLAMSVLLAFALVFAFSPASAFAVLPDQPAQVNTAATPIATTVGPRGLGHIDDGLPALSIHDADDDSLTAQAALPRSYSSRARGYVTPVKDQGASGFCWAYATIACMESSLIKRDGVDAAKLDLSERHLGYFSYHEAVDPLGGTAGDYNTPKGSAFSGAWFDGTGDPYLGVGGNAMLATGTLAKWAGAVDEAVAPMKELLDAYDEFEYEYYPSTGQDFTPEFFEARDAFTDATALEAGMAYTENSYLLEGMRMISHEDQNDVKQAIYDYGAVLHSMYMDDLNYFNETTNAYYNYEKPGVNHDVVIVGWDDDYPASNFVTYGEPLPKNGAWLVRNSWGEEWGDGGYFWLSYEDLSMTGSSVTAFFASPVDAYDHNYQYDGTSGNCANRVASGGSIANVFTANANEDGAEEVTAVSLSQLVDVNVDYSVQIYTDVKDAANPTSGTPALAAPVTGKMTYQGYYMVKLPEPVRVAQGSKYSVVFTLSHANGDDVYNTVDSTYGAGDKYGDTTTFVHFTSASSPNQSFVRSNDAATWFDLAGNTEHMEDDEAPSVARIKAFTNDVDFIDLGTCRLSVASDQAYRVNGCRPYVTLTYPMTGETWTFGIDSAEDLGLSLSYADNTSVGTAHATVAAASDGIFKAQTSISCAFDITRADIGDAIIEPVATQVWTGQPIMPALTVMLDGGMLAQDADYEVTYANNVDVGTATTTVTGIGNYQGMRTVSFAIDKPGAPDDSGANTPEPVATQVMYRAYNPNSGEHFYTAHYSEIENIVAAGWLYEGEAWTAPVASATPVYRLYSGTDHHYTTSTVERDHLISVGWSDEGIGWCSDDAQGVGLHRLFNPNVDPTAWRNNSGSHHYTTSDVERDHLVGIGWRYEDFGWYGVR